MKIEEKEYRKAPTRLLDKGENKFKDLSNKSKRPTKLKLGTN